MLHNGGGNGPGGVMRELHCLKCGNRCNKVYARK